MSAFTSLSETQLTALLAPRGWRPVTWQPAEHGIENSNYLIDAEDQQGQPLALVLTLFETLTAAELPWFAALLTRLAAAGLPVPCPIALAGDTVLRCCERPALLVPRLPGAHVEQPQAAQCAAVGGALARLHRLPPDLPRREGAEPDDRLRALLDWLPPDQPVLARAARQRVARWLDRADAPTLTHADLFRDNALFDGERLTGLLDFYNAGHGDPLYDLAVAINDWCVDAAGEPQPALQRAMLEGYRSERALTDADLAALPEALAVAALRFWLSRRASENQQALAGAGSKDPAPFARLYQRRVAALDAS